MGNALKHTCPHCIRTLTLNTSNFYMTKSKWVVMADTGRSIYCKECEKEYYLQMVSEHKDEMVAMYETCRFLDRPFSLKVLEMADSERTSIASKNLETQPLWAYYCAKVFSTGLKYVGKGTFKDSDDIKDSMDEKIKKAIDVSDFKITEDMINKWGSTHEIDEYKYLEREYNMFESRYEHDDYAMEMIFESVCKLRLQQKKEFDNGNTKEIKDLQDIINKTMSQGNLQPIQQTGLESEGKVSFGTYIDEWETTRPVKVYPDDEMKEYMEIVNVGQIAVMLGLDNKLTRKFKMKMGEYGITPDELQRIANGEDDFDIEDLVIDPSDEDGE